MIATLLTIGDMYEIGDKYEIGEILHEIGDLFNDRRHVWWSATCLMIGDMFFDGQPFTTFAIEKNPT